MSLAQALAILVFLAMFATIISGRVDRYIAALIGAAVTCIVVFVIAMRAPGEILQVLNVGQLGQLAFWIPGEQHIESHGVNWQTIVFIGGMMAMVEGLGEVGFFRWLCLFTAKLVGYRVVPILIAFMLLSGFLSMFIDSITVLLFLASVTIELGRLLKFDPVPVIIAEIFAGNCGGAATMSGDPPNIIIGTYFGYTFTDFAVNTGPIAWIGMLMTLGLFYLFFRRVLAKPFPPDASRTSTAEYPQPREAIINPRLFAVNTSIFILVIALLVTHAATGISVALIGVIAAGLTLAASRGRALHIIQRVDWRTLLFFLGLFVCVGGLEATGVLEMVANKIEEISAGNLALAIPFILWISAFTSAIVDNIPFAATMAPVIARLAATTGMNEMALNWSLALGTDIGGNATPIGASANVVGTAIAQREGYPITWGRFCKYAVPSTILVIAMSHLMLLIRYA